VLCKIETGDPQSVMKMQSLTSGWHDQIFQQVLGFGLSFCQNFKVSDRYNLRLSTAESELLLGAQLDNHE